MTHQNHAVELTKGPDFLDIWVDTNNNGVRDDDDVNIFVTKGGSVYAESATFKAALDAHLRDRLKEASMALMERFPSTDPVAEEQICTLALQMIVKATNEAAAQARELPPLPSAHVTALATMAEETVHAIEPHAEASVFEHAAAATEAQPEHFQEPTLIASAPEAWQESPATVQTYEASPDAGYTPPMAQEARDNWWAAAPAEAALAAEHSTQSTYTEHASAEAAWQATSEAASYAAPEAPTYVAEEGPLQGSVHQQAYATDPAGYVPAEQEAPQEANYWQAPTDTSQTVPLWTAPTVTTAEPLAQPQVQPQASSAWELQPQEVPRYTPPSNA